MKEDRQLILCKPKADRYEFEFIIDKKRKNIFGKTKYIGHGDTKHRYFEGFILRRTIKINNKDIVCKMDSEGELNLIKISKVKYEKEDHLTTSGDLFQWEGYPVTTLELSDSELKEVIEFHGNCRRFI